MSDLPPAIPQQDIVFEQRFFVVHELVTVFDDLYRERLQKQCNHILREPLENQLTLFEFE